MFRYDQEILTHYPTIRAGVIHVTGLDNQPSPADLVEDYLAQQQATIERLAQTPIAGIPSIATWRRVFSTFGARPTQYRNAAEALLRRLSKQGDIPNINTLVDLGNVVSIRYAMPVAVFDQAEIAPPTTVRFATGDEAFTDLGASQSIHPAPGEVIFVDADNIVSARRWCWRQSAQSATSPNTTEALITIEGHHPTAPAEIESALDDLAHLLTQYQPQATYTLHRLSPDHPSMIEETSE